MDDEARLHDPLPAPVIDAVRELYAPPLGDAYWAVLEHRVVRCVRTAHETGRSGWRSSTWVRAGLAAAATVLVVAAVLLLRAHTADLHARYRALVSPNARPVAESLAVPSGALGNRDGDRNATFRDVLTR